MSKVNNQLIDAEEKSTPKGKSWNIKTCLKGGGLALLFAVIIGAFYMYGVYYPSTDDAYIGSNLLNVSAKVGGFVENIYVENNQFVRKGQVLLDINPEDYSVYLNKAINSQIYSTNQLAAAKKSIQVAINDLNKRESPLF